MTALPATNAAKDLAPHDDDSRSVKHPSEYECPGRTHTYTHGRSHDGASGAALAARAQRSAAANAVTPPGVGGRLRAWQAGRRLTLRSL